MKCSLLSLSCYLDDELEAGKRGELEAHLVGCQRCSSGLTHLQEEVQRISGLAPIHVEEGSTRTLMEQLGLIMEGDPLPPRRSPRAVVPAPPASLPWLNGEAGKALPWRANRTSLLDTPRPDRTLPGPPPAIAGDPTPSGLEESPAAAPPSAGSALRPPLAPPSGGASPPPSALPASDRPPEPVPDPARSVDPEPAVVAGVMSELEAAPGSRPETVSDAGSNPEPDAASEPAAATGHSPEPGAGTGVVPDAAGSFSPTIELPGVSIQPRFQIPAGGGAPEVEVGRSEGAPFGPPDETPRAPQDQAPPAPLRADPAREVAPEATPMAEAAAPGPVAAGAAAEPVDRPFAAPPPSPVGATAWRRPDQESPLPDPDPAPLPSVPEPWQAIRAQPPRQGPLARLKERWAVQRALSREQVEAADDAQAVADLDATPEPRYETQAGPRAWSRSVPDADAEPTRRARAADDMPAPWTGPAGTFGTMSTTRPAPGRHSRPLLARRGAVAPQHASGIGPLRERMGSWLHNRALMAFVGSLLLLVIIAVSIGRAGPPTKSVVPGGPATASQPQGTTGGAAGAGEPDANPAAPPAGAPAPVALTDARTLGTGSSGAQVRTIRYGNHPGAFYRVVFDIAPAAPGTPTATVGFKDPTTLWVLIDGGVPGGAVPGPPDATVVTATRLVDPAPAGKIAYELKLAHPVTVTSQYLTSPMRLVLDLR